LSDFTVKLGCKIKRWRLHSFDFAFGLVRAFAGIGKCVQCALAIEFFCALAFFLFFFCAVAVQSDVGCCPS